MKVLIHSLVFSVSLFFIGLSCLSAFSGSIVIGAYWLVVGWGLFVLAEEIKQPRSTLTLQKLQTGEPKADTTQFNLIQDMVDNGSKVAPKKTRTMFD